ncbi:Nramp family divalent metal transporter [Amnibacterium sp. CER49]|uniref:Nramp family divalent metal transporter n=1 Tax=Amnibacterium sp. CER49 TaxID=3039161 RepID=UPI00244958E3|nr:Nramp family divalent metal transporter [Amnibacterium sp. CER49]MDH2443448.1 Nramp family divalent metal transporter [Amnibacterium sp. CER49]
MVEGPTTDVVVLRVSLIHGASTARPSRVERPQSTAGRNATRTQRVLGRAAAGPLQPNLCSFSAAAQDAAPVSSDTEETATQGVAPELDRGTDREPGHIDQRRSPIARFFGVLGPGLVTGAADDDPSGVATYAQAGATYGMGMLWTVPVSLPLMMGVQEICDRMALATGDSLGKLIRRRFPRAVVAVLGVLVVALIAANCLNLAADLMAIGQGMQLLHAGPAPVWSAVAGIAIVVALLAGSFQAIGRIFKWLCLFLLVYVAVLFFAHVSWADVGRGLLGLQARLSPAYLGLVVGVLGTSISPYMFFWQSAQRVEELRAEPLEGDLAPPLKDRSRTEARRRLRNGRVDVFTGMAFSVLIMFAIMAATAATLGAHHRTVSSAAEAARALEPIAGSYAGILFAAGFIGSGVLAVPILAASGAAGLSGLLGKEWGLDRSPRKAPVFYALLGVGLIAGTVLSVIGTDPIGLLVLSAIVNGIAAGPFLIVMMLISRDRAIMGRYRNGRLAAAVGWTTTVIMCAAGGYGIWYTITGG